MNGHTEQFKQLNKKFDGYSTQLMGLTNEVKNVHEEVKEVKNEVKQLRSDQANFLSTLLKTIADHIQVLNAQTQNV